MRWFRRISKGMQFCALSASEANRVPPSDLFSHVCHGDSITRSCDISTVCSFLPRVPSEGTSPSLYFFFLFYGRPPSRAGQVSSLPRSSLFPAGPFSPLAGFSRLAPGHYLIFRLETSHPQEKRSRGGRGARGTRKGGHRTGGDRGKCFRVITFVSASAFPL